MSTIREHGDDEDEPYIQLEGEESDEVEAAIAEADAHPEDNIPWDDFIRRLRNSD
jgi:hypothetical protein